MISRFIKILCYVLMAISVVVGFVLLVLGISSLIDKNSYAWLFIIGGIALPFASIISLYPLFALSCMEEHLRSLNEKIALLSPTDTSLTREIPPKNPSIQDQKPIISQPQFEHIPPFLDTIAFINKKYLTDLCEDDSIDIIKKKIMNIENPPFSAIILQSKISSATTKEEIINLLNMHRVAHS